MSFTPPQFHLAAFNCPHCKAFAHMRWDELWSMTNHGMVRTDAEMALCTHCTRPSYWRATSWSTDAEGKAIDGAMVYPRTTTAPQAHSDMPADVLKDYEEAKSIAQESPRASAALLRLCIQKLCQHLGEPGKNLNDDIGSLVKKGLPIEIQQSLDIVRVVGNNAVHPGELSSDDVRDVSGALFELVNHIVEDRISRPKKLAMLFKTLPAKALSAIEKRDGE